MTRTARTRCGERGSAARDDEREREMRVWGEEMGRR
jgi:hypothetical protein